MNRAEKKAKAKAQKRAAKEARYKRSGGISKYARKFNWRVRRLGGAPIPAVFGPVSFDAARQMEEPVIA